MTQPRKRICILGSTGSIGENTLRVVHDFADRFEIVGLAANRSAVRLAEQAAQFGVQTVCIGSETPDPGIPGAAILRGEPGLCELIDRTEPDLVVVATVGKTGLRPTLRAIERGVTVALANKEVLVTAGPLVIDAARRHKVDLLPIDSEHNAIFQCRQVCARTPLRRVILTASGGPFRGRSWAELEHVTVAEALAHPTWTMGSKITIDSATLMNKGFEAIEAHHLFDLPPGQIEVIVHPQSAIHGILEYHDGSMLAQMGVTDMYFPISNVLAHPERLPNARFEPLDLAALAAITFEAPDLDAFPCLRYAYEVMRTGGTAPAVLNAANEVAVARFLEGEIRFTDIPRLIERALEAHDSIADPDLGTIEAADAETRTLCGEAIRTGAVGAH